MKNLLPTITIVTVAYNAQKVIEETIRSVLDQDYPHLEYWIIDGASKDKTLSIIEKYSPYLNYISEPDKGVYEAMNKGINKAIGEWILFMNAGDYFYSNSVISDFFDTEENYDKYSVLYGDAEFRLKNIAYISEASHSVSSDQYMPFSHQAAFTRTSIAKNVKFDLEYKIASDTAFFLRLVREGHQMKHIAKVVCSYNALEGLSADNEVKRSKEIVLLQAEWNNVDPNSLHFKHYIRSAKIKQFVRSIIPNALWVMLRERTAKKKHQRISKIG